MDTVLKYGDSEMNVNIDDKDIQQVIEGNKFDVNKSEEEVIDYALSHPIGSAKLSELVHEGETVCIVIPDITRSWQRTDKYLYKIVDELNTAGVKDKDITFLSATGTHRKQTEEEHEALLGKDLYKRFKVIDHDCKDRDNLVYLGKTTYGTPVSVNKKILESDHVIITGAIVYHLLAGWSGGKKTILPGISSYETIMHNHSLSLRNEGGVNPAVRSGNIEKNSVHEDMLQAASFIRPTFMFNVIIGGDGKIVHAVAGNYIAAHAEGRDVVDQIDGVKINEKGDIVLACAGGYPKDINLYQCSKTLINAKEAAKEGGTIIMVAECREGIGGDEGMQNIILKYANMEDREKALRADYTISKFIGYFICDMAVKFKLIFVSDLAPDVMKKINITVVKTADEALKIAYKNENSHKIIFMPHGSSTLPKIEDKCKK